jgi:hypothetical protein
VRTFARDKGVHTFFFRGLFQIAAHAARDTFAEFYMQGITPPRCCAASVLTTSGNSADQKF